MSDRKGKSSVTVVGTVTGHVLFSETRLGDPAGTFLLVVEDGRNETLIRINLYGEDLIRQCRSLQSGNVVSVFGELMNRSTKEGDRKDSKLLTEVRATTVLIHNGGEQEQL